MAKKNVLTKGKKAQAERLALGGQWAQAEPLYASVCKIDPTDAEAWAKLAAVRFRLGRHVDAESAARRALALVPGLGFAQQTLATILQYQGKSDEASFVLQERVKQQPSSTEALLNLARLRETQGHVKEAFALYHRALDTQPDSEYVLAKRGELLEKEGRLQDAAESAARGLAKAPLSPVLNLTAARIDRRMGRHAEAAARLETVLDQEMADELGMEIHLLLGQLCDRLGHEEKVLPHLLEGKRRMVMAADPDGSRRVRFLASCRTARSRLSDRLIATPLAAPTGREETPVFLIGFPRSGTTLLEQILDSHPGLQTLDEKPMAEVMERAFLEMSGNTDDALADLSSEQIAALRQVYWREAGNHIARSSGTLLVDKLPLNLTRVSLLWRVFPEAHFILAIRHPCDVVLSCLMQNFGINDAMVGYVSLENIARIYTEVMGSWLECVERLPLHWQRIRYEDLITNFEPEARRLLEFIGVDWSDAVLDHTEHARQRGIINTPSYHQVTQPIYQHARYRWKRYEQHFSEVLPLLKPFVDEFGYA